MKNIQNIVVITPVWNESLGMIQQFLEGIDKVRRKLSDQGIGFRHFFLNDGAVNLPEEYSILVRHQKNEGLAKTLLDGYKAVFQIKTKPDLVIKLDCQEHDPEKILLIVDHCSHSSAQVLFLPVWYWTEKEERPLMIDIVSLIVRFVSSLNPMDKGTIFEIFDRRLPLGYQCFRIEALELLLPDIEKGIRVFQKKFGKPATWGLDFLIILLAANKIPGSLDFVFGGWSKPWQENRSRKKIEIQRQKIEIMVEVARELGCK